ncbi:Type-1A pilin [Cedecea neteri]|uniref:Fimbriae assembly protein n=1 Tax=Cedecea neteri TaxID=158822 RepID=A0A291DTW9_9ENTR|nr:fimbria assembly protein [Cedecea neteri]ATF91008.1 fimbriae assembly protein [Cedecea neteri]SQA99401.1 Type-1A pilin [Cedecea neteri]
MKKLSLTAWVLFSVLLNPTVKAASPLGEINVELRGNIVDFTCVVETGSDNKTVKLGSWPTKQLRTAGSTTQAMPFNLKLTGCPPGGTASITFNGKSTGTGLLALNAASTAKNVAIELMNEDKSRLLLNDASKTMPVDANGDVTLKFWANYIATADNADAGLANADATFLISYN